MQIKTANGSTVEEASKDLPLNAEVLAVSHLINTIFGFPYVEISYKSLDEDKQ